VSKRIVQGVTRETPISIAVNDRDICAYPGESVATALLAAGITGFSRDRRGRSRGPFCNMGVCYDCLVLIEYGLEHRAEPARVRACLTRVQAGMRVRIPE
jgi:hypothetical protein